MDKEEFDQKFKEFISILTSNSEISEKFAEIPTIEESFPLACSLVGDMDLDMYEKAIIRYANDDFSDFGDIEKELGTVSGGTNSFRFDSFVRNISSKI